MTGLGQRSATTKGMRGGGVQSGEADGVAQQLLTDAPETSAQTESERGDHEKWPAPGLPLGAARLARSARTQDDGVGVDAPCTLRARPG